MPPGCMARRCRATWDGARQATELVGLRSLVAQRTRLGSGRAPAVRVTSSASSSTSGPGATNAVTGLTRTQIRDNLRLLEEAGLIERRIAYHKEKQRPVLHTRFTRKVHQAFASLAARLEKSREGEAAA